VGPCGARAPPVLFLVMPIVSNRLAVVQVGRTRLTMELLSAGIRLLLLFLFRCWLSSSRSLLLFWVRCGVHLCRFVRTHVSHSSKYVIGAIRESDAINDVLSLMVALSEI
jgi:hypothetical protein